MSNLSFKMAPRPVAGVSRVPLSVMLCIAAAAWLIVGFTVCALMADYRPLVWLFSTLLH
jgi:hypothetical protein